MKNKNFRKALNERKAKVKNKLFVAPIDKKNNRPYTLSFFSGVRGLDIGARKAGFTTLFHSDWWIAAGNAFQLNTPEENANCPDHLKSEGLFAAGSQCGDINQLDFEKIVSLINEKLGIKIEEGQISVVHGGPPCQGYSKCNTHRKEFEDRNFLIFQLLRIINQSKAKVGLIEQVPDLLSNRCIRIWSLIKSVLNSMTDYIWDYRVMDASQYGARQRRKRVIIMLVRRDLNVPITFPEPAEPDLSKVSVQALLPHVYHFSPGQFADKIKLANDRIFCTMTATGSEYFYGLDGVRRKPLIWERLVLTDLEGLNLTGIPVTSQKKLLGNMVQVSFAEALFSHIRTQILKDGEGSNDLSLAA